MQWQPYKHHKSVDWQRQWRIHGGRGGRSPPRLGPKKFIARPKNTLICKPPFACQNVLKLTYSNLEFPNFPGEDPRIPLFKGRGGRRGRGKGSEGGRGRIGKGRDGKGEGQGRSQYEAKQGNCLVLFSSATNFCTLFHDKADVNFN